MVEQQREEMVGARDAPMVLSTSKEPAHTMRFPVSCSLKRTSRH